MAKNSFHWQLSDTFHTKHPYCLLVLLKEFDPLMVNVPLYFDDSNFTKSYTSPWVFFKFSKLYKLRNSSQLRQSIQE